MLSKPVVLVTRKVLGDKVKKTGLGLLLVLPGRPASGAEKPGKEFGCNAAIDT